MPHQWAIGDRLVHTRKPEWGVGQVTVVARQVHEGEACQLVSVRFDGAGLKKINTGMAELAPASGQATQAGGWLDELEGDEIEQRLAELPEAATDPFSSPLGRLRHTLDLYRYDGSGRSLMEWAIAQTHHQDPLSRFSRHQLESSFARFRTSLDRHLAQLVQDLLRSDPKGLMAEAKHAPPAARPVLQRLARMR